MDTIYLLIVDDHALFRDGLRALFSALEDIELVGEAIRNELIKNPQDALPIFDQLYIKAQALAIASGEKTQWQATIDIVNELSLAYDKQVAKRIYNQKIVENMEEAQKKAKEEGVRLTQEQIDKIEEETWAAAALGADPVD